MAGLYLTSAGVTYLGQLMDQTYQGKETGKGLSTNDFTTALLEKLNGIAAGAQANVLEVIKVNGQPIAISGKAVNIDLSAYALKTDIADVIRFKGEAASYTALPDDPEEGDLYIVQTADPTHEIDEGEAVIWNGSVWVDVGGIFSVDLSDYAHVDHSHDIGDVTGLLDALAAKLDASQFATKLSENLKPMTTEEIAAAFAARK